MHSSLIGRCLLGASLAAVATLPAPVCLAGSPAFPWHTPAPVGSVPVRVLSQPAVAPIEPLPPKQAYPYGWFGSKPTPQWKRSFGVSRAYTQWSRY